MIYPNRIADFWCRYPALLYSVSLLLGISFSFHVSFLFLFPVIVLFCVFLLSRGRAFFAFLFFIFGIFYTSLLYELPSIPFEGKEVKGIFSISSLTTSTTHFGKKWLYRGFLREVHFNNECSLKKIPCSIALIQQEGLVIPVPNCDYLIEGTLKEIAPRQYILKVNKNKPWHSISDTFSIASSRYFYKKWLSDYIKSKFIDSKVSTFLAGIATGEFDDRYLSFEFGRFGLQHIMAISGFHFVIIASIMGVFFRAFLSYKKASVALLLILGVYFFFLGMAPSVMRAWITISMGLIALFVERSSSGLNILGFALLVGILWDPLSVANIGFQFSFATTAAILLFNNPCNSFLNHILPSRKLSEMIEMNIWNQHAYGLLIFFRQSLALMTAVNIIVIPLTLFLFHKFPIMSFVYNLFFPFFVSFSMALLIFSLMLDCISFSLGNLLHGLNENFTKFLLDFLFYAPSSLDFTLRVQEFTFYLFFPLIVFIFLIGILIHQKSLQEGEFLTH